MKVIFALVFSLVASTLPQGNAEAAEISALVNGGSEEGKLHDDSLKSIYAQLIAMQDKIVALHESVNNYENRIVVLESENGFLKEKVASNEARLYPVENLIEMYSSTLELASTNEKDNDMHYDSINAYESALNQAFQLITQHLKNDEAGTDGNEPTVVYDTVTFTAAAKGANFKIPSSIVDGVNDLDAIKAAWDTANPTQVVNFSGQAGTYVPAVGDVQLADGRRSYAQLVSYITYE